ncbi:MULTISPECIES: enoyl-CoA hydratase/isomerase family protein [Rhodococcus]|uniref:enoyl-CoA hydratase/isomerase family protein n=1 Tax=Rhodococcus TaxID=1827 RepID=UPI00082CC673|nr:enoyl-CoA hydratase-related protein [Rhodococcus phenolicus]
MKSDVLRSTRDGAVAILELNRPSAKNSLNHDLLVALRRELAAAKHDGTVRAVVITGADGVFCAGADITTFDVLRQQSLLGDREALGGDIWSALGTYRKPVIAAVEGLALGGGCELALACDIVIAGESAKFGVPEVKLGVIPGGGGTQRLIHAVGKSKAMAMLLTGDFISAQKACGDGIVADTVPDSTTLDHALKMAQRIAKNSPLAVELAKDAALRAYETSLSQGLEHEKRNFDVALRSDDCHEGQAAFLQKRAPEFTGK